MHILVPLTPPAPRAPSAVLYLSRHTPPRSNRLQPPSSCEIALRLARDSNQQVCDKAVIACVWPARKYRYWCCVTLDKYTYAIVSAANKAWENRLTYAHSRPLLVLPCERLPVPACLSGLPFVSSVSLWELHQPARPNHLPTFASRPRAVNPYLCGRPPRAVVCLSYRYPGRQATASSWLVFRLPCLQPARVPLLSPENVGRGEREIERKKIGRTGRISLASRTVDPVSPTKAS